MIVADTSALVLVASIDLLDVFLTEFDVHTTEPVVKELEDTSEYDDSHGDSAEHVLDNLGRIDTPEAPGEFTSSRVDAGEGSCALLANELEVDSLITDDLGSLPELHAVADATVPISLIVLKALVQRDVLERGKAPEMLDKLTEQRDWLGAPIYSRARNLFDPA